MGAMGALSGRPLHDINMTMRDERFTWDDITRVCRVQWGVQWVH